MSRLTSRERRHRAGLTMVEMLIAMLMFSVVGIILASLMMGQQRFFQRTSESINIRRELRSAMSLVPADLRSISSSGGDISEYGTNSLTFRNIFGSSIVCNRVNNRTFDMPPEAMTTNTLTNWYTIPTAGDTVWAFNDSLSLGAEDDVWTPLEIDLALASSSGFCVGSPYITAADVGRPRFRVTVTSDLPAAVQNGAVLRFTRSTRYRLEQQTSGRWYLTRSEYAAGAWGDATPVSGPYAPPSGSGSTGIRFTYFDSLGNAVANGGTGRNISRIDLRLRARGAASSGAGPNGTTANTDSLAFRVALRNRQ